MSNQNNTSFDKIALSYQNGLTFVKLADIIYGIADNNYTQMYLKDGRRLLSTKSLREIQELFEEQQFVRVHRQFIVNIDEIIKLVRGDNYHLLMSDHKNIPISRSQKDKLISRIGWK
jgi:two-component system LytT family response regulator